MHNLYILKDGYIHTEAEYTYTCTIYMHANYNSPAFNEAKGTIQVCNVQLYT